jgi:hypothetical protein
MKRRVLRQHSNKKVLRVLGSTHHLRPPYHVVCDASFIRAFAAREKTKRIGDVIADAVGAPCDVCCIPETALTFDRRQQQRDSADVSGSLKENIRCRADDAKVRAVLNQVAHVGALHDPPKNELKAVWAYAQASMAPLAAFSSASNQGLPSGLSSSQPGRFIFIATASHDLRKLIEADASARRSFAFIRLTFNPTAAWVDPPMPVPASRRNHPMANGVAGAPSSIVASSPASSLLSPADRAFMRHLKVIEGGGGRAAAAGGQHARSSVKRGRDPAPLPSCISGSGLAGSERAAPGSGRGLTKHRKPAAPNPLSMKKKRVRETLVVGVDCVGAAPGSKKHRTEQKKETGQLK